MEKSSTDTVLERVTQAALEWDRIVEMLAQQARSPMGAERCRQLPLETDFEGALARRKETAELIALEEWGVPLPSLVFPDLRDVVGRAVKGATLEPHDLRDCSQVLTRSLEVAEFFDCRLEPVTALKSLAPTLSGSFSDLGLQEDIDRAVDEEGNIRDSATPELHNYSQRAKELKRQIRRRLETILASRRYAEVLQEQYFAIREGRYVVPIKADQRSKIPGIVHDVSSSGATVFLEPRELVELNNGIKVAELEVARETRRILHELSVRVGEQGAALFRCMEELARLDCVSAKGAFRHLIKGRLVPLNQSGRILLRQARHPLLMLAREQVVANDVLLDESIRVLVISGPNTGGKTVTLKIVGLFALMVRAGLPLPCGVDSEMAVFPEVFADIGDAQDLAKDLSSFSAHMAQIIQLLRHAGAGETGVDSLSVQGGDALSVEREPVRTLVLLDELVTSTDPAEGAALAEALLRKLSRMGMKVVVTTHYNSLKVLAQTAGEFHNASVEFDVSRLAPTYRLLMGVPGGSSAIDIAGRLGLDESILEEAQACLHHDDRVLEHVLSDLQEKQRRLDEDHRLIAQLKRDADEAAREAQAITERLKETEREDRKGIRAKLREDLLRARSEVQSIMEDLKQDRTLIKARRAKEHLAELDERLERQLNPAPETIPLDRLNIHDRVEIKHLGIAGALLEQPMGKKRVRVLVGNREMSVETDQLVGIGAEEVKGPAGKRESIRSFPHASRPDDRERTSEGSWADDSGQITVLDLRGQVAEEAIDRTVAALDRAVLAGCAFLRIIHGHGTGRLKSVIRDYLKQSPYVGTFRSGERTEGGDGVTIVEMK